jgi:two-component sensor histidine kinase
MADPLAELQLRMLENVARGGPADSTLTDLCSSVEPLIPGTIVGITVLDRAARSFEHSIFPSLPSTFSEALKGARVAERPGSCALAVFQGSTVVSEDIATDKRFQDGWKTLSLNHGIVSIQSRPVFTQEGTALGTLVVGFATPRTLSDAEERAIDVAVRLAGTILTRRRLEARHELLVGELQHRTRNLFSAVGAVVYSTLKAYPDPKAFRKVFDGRLAALSRAHSLVLDNADADLKSLLTDILAPYSIDHTIKMNGPAFTLSSEAAVAFSLAAHELATNAIKYGALSNSGGALDIRWDVTRDEQGENQFKLQWRESGGPSVAKPARSGFGRNAIERSLAHTVDASVVLDFDPSGLVCTIRAPVTARLGGRTN